MTFNRCCRPLGILLTCLAVVAGCNDYGSISPTAYEYAKALYSITNRQAEEKLGEVRQQIDAAAAEGDLTDREARWLKKIVDDAEDGDWRAANKASRAMMEDQIH